MSTPLYKQLTNKLRQVPGSQNWYATATLILPAAATADAPLWSPGPGYLQALTGSVYLKPVPDGAEAVIINQFAPGGVYEQMTGPLTTWQLLGPDGVLRRLRAAYLMPLQHQALRPDHPAVRYRCWVDQLATRIGAHLPPAEHGHDTGARVYLRRDGRFQASFAIGINPLDRWHQATVTAACALAAAAAEFGGTQLRLDQGITGHLSDPLLHHAWRQLTPAGPAKVGRLSVRAR
ncbi:hypothetical protein AB0B66_10480 [Catellatospora sp. NPDC049111]|uniref:hypothetical protein n=1 Tax=Catellatospora sp. NPDC049111 TaxID=3155271 RepID=UPI003409DFDA